MEPTMDQLLNSVNEHQQQQQQQQQQQHQALSEPISQQDHDQDQDQDQSQDQPPEQGQEHGLDHEQGPLITVDPASTYHKPSHEPQRLHLVFPTTSNNKKLSLKSLSKFVMAERNDSFNYYCQFYDAKKQQTCNQVLEFQTKQSRTSHQADKCTRHLLEEHNYIPDPMTILYQMDHSSTVFQNAYPNDTFQKIQQNFEMTAPSYPKQFSDSFISFKNVMVHSKIPATILESPFFLHFAKNYISGYDSSWTRRNYVQCVTHSNILDGSGHLVDDLTSSSSIKKNKIKKPTSNTESTNSLKNKSKRKQRKPPLQSPQIEQQRLSLQQQLQQQLQIQQQTQELEQHQQHFQQLQLLPQPTHTPSQQQQTQQHLQNLQNLPLQNQR
ncbi:uncharacterized protein NDAI_0F04540 [Naumovozyma dairenensis CBS 421]|uniref:Uncharacterized protein n=1 Tax=Naumovozyma dairenensis (strain ATCC 10597 / BCRC 20456 / CBS 421 / NBRC 0211 / NRRL Y-12639) TaxID=1071378 RepID=G0WDB1_NAUDC|nr:hypothetical protein NDAI_0F04540 [Naumovozyma dairenensis CBS 421]CCD25772.1 hypothetical protein NDAI_0F04540 [Naumovozyma dairenensis CBS 421]